MTPQTKINPYAMTLAEAISHLEPFVTHSQWQAMKSGMRGEEGAFFKDKVLEYGQRIAIMPITYEQDGKGNQAKAYLHFFTSASDWYILEKDASGADEDGQAQMFGYGVLNGDTQNAELGYISLNELLDHGAEFDLHFETRTLEAIKQAIKGGA